MTATEFLEEYSVERRNTGCEKWDGLQQIYGQEDLLPLWVADMDFKTPPAVQEAMVDKIQHGAFGYGFAPAGYHDAVSNWQQNRHGYKIQKEWLRFSSGVVSALYRMVGAFTAPEDAIMIMTPVYYPFKRVIEGMGRKTVAHSLQNTNGRYTIDFKGFEEQIAQNAVKILVYCSPHNPVGRVWTLEEHESVLNICRKHNVLVISDEIHQDILLAKSKHIPTLSVAGGSHADHVVTLTAASKTFNMAGLAHAHIFLADEKLRKQYDDYIKATMGEAPLNIMSCVATQAAYQKGEDWLEGLLRVIEQNYLLLKQEVEANLPKAILSPLEGTYLAWLDLRGYLGTDVKKVKQIVQEKAKLAIDFGEWFGEEGRGFIRINLGTTPAIVKQAVSQLIEAINEG
ncbi:MAG: MalY/PatB family protein [Oscillospiraceae bacterium]